MQLRAGALMTFALGDSFALYLDPQIGFGLTKRDDGNKEVLTIPARFAWQATTHLAGFLDSGVNAPFDGFSDGWSMPLGAGVLYAFSNRFDLGGKFNFDRLAASHGGGTDARTLSVFTNIRF
jgi:hypothetical protein